MAKLAANLSLLFTELPIEARFAAAARAGFAGVEILFPYDIAATPLLRASIASGLPIVLMNAPPPNWSGGPCGYAAQPAQADRFRHDLTRALRVAEALRVPRLHLMAGEAEGAAAEACFIANLRHACAAAPRMAFTIEPLNPQDRPGYFLADFDRAAAILDAVGAPNLGLQFDAYHAQIITGDALGTLHRHRDRITHVQIAGLPGRGEPVAGGGLDPAAIVAALDASGYAGWVAAEYTPRATTEAGLGWLRGSAAGPVAARPGAPVEEGRQQR